MEKLDMKNLGIWNVIDDPASIVAMAENLDFVIIDLEHGFRDFSRFSSTFLSLRNITTAMVRPRFFRDPWVQSFLDLGIKHFVVPQLSSVKDLEDFLSHLRYFPQGTRGVHPKSNLYVANSNSFEVIPIVETIEFLDDLDSTLQFEEVTGVYFGAYDLAQRLGLESPMCKEVNEQLTQVIALLNRYGKKLYYMPLNEEQRELSDTALYPNVVVGIDLEILSESVQNTLKWT